MKIAYVLPEFITEKEAGGLATYYDNIARMLSDAGHRIYIFVLSERNETLAYYPGIVVERVYVELKHVNVRIPGSFIRERSRVFAEKLSEYIKKGIRFDLIQYPNLWALGLGRLNLPTVVRISSYQPILRAADQECFDINGVYDLRKVSDFLETISTLMADGIYSPSRCTADLISGHTGRDIKIIESPFYPRNAQRKTGKIYEKKLAGKKYILTFGTLKILKGAKLIGDCIYRVLDTCPDLTWVFAGAEFPWRDRDGVSVSPVSYIKEHASEYEDRTVFLGKLDHEELFPVIQHALFCVMPSRIDNLPNTCIEAMALEKVVIGTYGASFEQLIEDGKNGFLTERENEKMLIDRIQYVYGLSEEKRREIGAQAKKRIACMKPEKIMTELLEFYQSVIQSFHGMRNIDGYTRSVIEKYNDAMRHLEVEGAEQYILSL